MTLPETRYAKSGALRIAYQVVGNGPVDLVFVPAFIELESFGKPDEVREFPKGRVELIKVGGVMIGRAVFEPGWRWATSVQPITPDGASPASRANSFRLHPSC